MPGRLTRNLINAGLLAIVSGSSVAAAPPGFTSEDKADVICLLRVSSILGSLSEQKVTAEQRMSLVSGATYFTGKLRGRHPTVEMTEILAPDYLVTLVNEIDGAGPRCAKEMVKVGTDMKQAGAILIDFAKSQQPAR